MEAQVFSILLASLISALPFALMLLIGIVIAIIRWQRHPRLSLLVTITLILLIVSRILSTAAADSIPLILVRTQISFVTLSIYSSLFGLIITAPLWGLLFWAIFGWRTPPVTAISSQSQPDGPLWQ
ncbi:MAG TPA: hypothetical protein VFN35_20100 [Ktedonobacteraceae bacterium]|nr:hypothetical protein [Ktedonobacteraceae bacterium]